MTNLPDTEALVAIRVRADSWWRSIASSPWYKEDGCAEDDRRALLALVDEWRPVIEAAEAWEDHSAHDYYETKAAGPCAECDGLSAAINRLHALRKETP